MPIKRCTCCYFVSAFYHCKNKGNKTGSKKIAVVVSTLNNPWFVFLAKQLQQKQKHWVMKQKSLIRKIILRSKAIILKISLSPVLTLYYLTPTDANGSVANVLKAKAAGIPVFCMDREVNSVDAATSQILSDSYSGAVAIGKYFTQQLNKKGNYVELLGLVGDNNTWASSRRVFIAWWIIIPV